MYSIVRLISVYSVAENWNTYISHGCNPSLINLYMFHGLSHKWSAFIAAALTLSAAWSPTNWQYFTVKVHDLHRMCSPLLHKSRDMMFHILPATYMSHAVWRHRHFSFLPNCQRDVHIANERIALDGKQTECHDTTLWFAHVQSSNWTLAPQCTS